MKRLGQCLTENQKLKEQREDGKDGNGEERKKREGGRQGKREEGFETVIQLSIRLIIRTFIITVKI